MNDKDKTKEELIKELQELRLEHNSRKASYKKDITDCKRSEHNLKESEAQYRLLFEKMNSGFQLNEVIVDENNEPIDFRYIDGNTQMSTYTGFSIEEVRGKTIKELIPNADIKMIRSYGNVALTGVGLDLEYFSQTFNKYLKIAAYSPKKGQFAVIFDDISQRKLTEKNLIDNEEKLRTIISTTSQGFWLIDGKGHFLDVNSAYCELIGYTREELLLMSVNDIESVESKHEIDLHIKKILKTGQDRFETIHKRKDGQYVSIEISVSYLGFSEDLFVAFILNINDRIKAEKELKKKMDELTVLNNELENYTYANQELKQFAYSASHQLQEPIRTVSNYTLIIEEDFSEQLGEKGLKYLHTIWDSTRRMAMLIDSLLEFSQLGRNKKLVYVDCKRLIENVIADLETLRVASNAVIEVTEMPELKLYEVEIRQLFQNLITNAIKYKRKDIQPKIQIRSEKINDKWKFSISDNGIGISSEHFKKIFDIFQRLHLDEQEFEGKGIGLAYCNKIVQLHQGEIWVESTVGEGTTFHFTLPVL
jgi:PAS domain S-box-containing protein